MLDKIFLKLERFVPAKYRWVLSHDGVKRYFANTGWMFFGQMFSLLVSFFIGAWIARYLGPENYGILNYAVAFVGLFSFISALGIDAILSRELVKYPEKRDELLGTSFRLKLIGGIIALILCIMTAFLLKTSSIIRLLIILFSFSFIIQALNVISIYFQSEVKSKNNVKATLFATAISSVLKVAVILLNKGVIWIVVVFVFDSVWLSLGLVSAYKKHGLKIKVWKFNKILARGLLKDSWPLMLAAAAGFVNLKIDQVMIGNILGTYEVGLYAAAVKITEIFYFIPNIFCFSLFPAIVNAKKVSLDFYRSRLKNFYLLMAGVSLLIALPVFFFSKLIILTLFGKAFALSVGILKIYVWSSIGLFMGWAINYYLISENMIRTIFVSNLVAMIVNVVLNLILIPRIGLNGAALATLVSYCVPPLLIFRFNKYWRLIERKEVAL